MLPERSAKADIRGELIQSRSGSGFLSLLGLKQIMPWRLRRRWYNRSYSFSCRMSPGGSLLSDISSVLGEKAMLILVVFHTTCICITRRDHRSGIARKEAMVLLLPSPSRKSLLQVSSLRHSESTNAESMAHHLLSSPQRRLP